MIASLRRRHRLIFLLLALAVPLGFGIALQAKSDLAGAHAAKLPVSAQLQGDQILAWTDGPFELRLDPNEQPIALELIPQSASQAPDVLAYWVVDGANAKGRAIPTGARLLGVAQGYPTTLLDAPDDADLKRDELWLYSLALQERVARFTLAVARRK